MTEVRNETADVVVVGGGAAGLSAALTLARARRSVVVVDGGRPRNAPARAAHGLLGLDGVDPLELLARGRAEVEGYGARVVPGQVTGTTHDDDGFAVRLDDGTTVRADQLVVATGVVDELPDLPGVRERWGKDVVHCPYCHGWEIRDRRIGLLATGPMSAKQALLFGQWTEHLVFFAQDVPVSADDRALLDAAGATVVDDRVTGLTVSDADRLVGVRFAGGAEVGLDALAVPAPTTVRTTGLEALGLETATGPAGTTLVVDAAGHTTVPGVWAAGNAVHAGQQVSEAAANGARVAMTLNTELVLRDAELRRASA